MSSTILYSLSHYFSPGTSKKNSCGFLRRHHANAIAGAANNRAAPAATPPAIAPVALPAPEISHTSFHLLMFSTTCIEVWILDSNLDEHKVKRFKSSQLKKMDSSNKE